MAVSVIFLTRKLQPYRIPILLKIVELADIKLTVGHAGTPLLDDVPNIDELILGEKEYWKFILHDQDLLEICNEFDVAVVMAYLQRLSFMRLLVSRRRKFKIIFWGIGVKASGTTKFDQPTIMNHFRYYIANRSDASIFYTDYAKNKHIDNGVDKDKLFVMQNTVKVSNNGQRLMNKDIILFVGALYWAKRLDVLLEAFALANKEVENLPDLHIIGGGAEYENLENWVIDNGLTKNIFLHGPIFDEEVLRDYFSRAIATISPGQAGLSVLKSMGYGSPFITKVDAATGGERLNITDGFNGILYNEFSDLKDVLIDVSTNKEKYIVMGDNAKKYYENNRTPSQMASGFIDAVEFVTRL